MKILVCLILLLSLNIKSAEFTFEAYGINNMKNSVVTKNKEYTYFSFINEGVIITNIDRVGESHCAGGLNIIKGKMNSDILCENIRSILNLNV